MADSGEDNKLLTYFRKARHTNARWKILGFCLGVDKGDLDSIEKENHTMDSCMLEMLDFWVKAYPDHSEKKLKDALKECYPSTKNGYHKAAASMTISSSTQAKLESYKDEFMEIVWKASEALRERFSNVRELAVKVNEIMKDDKGEPLVFEPLPTSHSEVFPKLQKQWSYTNPEFLHQLIHQILEKHTASRRTSGKRTAKKHTSGKRTVGTTLKRKIESYWQSYRSFCQSLEITNESHIQFEAYDSSKPCLILTIKKGPLQLKDIYSFLENEFDIKNRYLRIHTIEPGSIKVILQFPATMTELFQAYIDQKQEAVKDFVEMKIKPLPPKHTDDGQHTQLELLKRHANDKPIVQPEDRKRHAVTDQLVKYEPTDELFAQPKPPKTHKMNDK